MGTFEGNTVNVKFLDAGNNYYAALATDDLIQGYGGADTILGNAKDNSLFGDQREDPPDYDGVDFDPTADGADYLYGYGGDDLLNPGAGVGNYAAGGEGSDTLDYRYATPGQTVTIDMETGSATAGTYGSSAFIEIENVLGSMSGPNVITGDSNANDIRGGAFDDTLHGADGKDTLIGYAGHDVLRGGIGGDVLKGGDGNDKLFGAKGGDWLVGGKGGDKIDGGKGHDTLIGGKGKDRLLGMDGKDVLIAGPGSDTLTGGGAADTFVFNRSSGYNKITDFEINDIISIGSGAKNFFQLSFTDAVAGLRIEFSNVEIFLKGLDSGDVSASNFDFF